MTLPSTLAMALAKVLGEPPARVQRIGGGDINQAARFMAGERVLLVKWHDHPPTPTAGWLSMFGAEAEGLKLLASANAVRVPEVVAYGDADNGAPAYILMEWIERGNGGQGAAGEALGQRLAAMHRVTAPAYGLEYGNYCGATPQDNRWSESWIEFYGQRRLGIQMALAGPRGLLPKRRRDRLERLIDRLDTWIDERACRPSLLHGDLWGGNWLVDSAGQPVLIDPAVTYGDREAELAMCRLFGGFPREFYLAYDTAWPPGPGRDDRIPLYQLYHVLNHLNLFGKGYGGHADNILTHYMG